jgi:hypothetical protein
VAKIPEVATKDHKERRESEHVLEPYGSFDEFGRRVWLRMGFVPDQQVTPDFNFLRAHRLMALKLAP